MASSPTATGAPPMPLDSDIVQEAWRICTQHGMALHRYWTGRSASYEGHPDLYAERARRAELDCRAVLAAGLAVFNELRDTGQGEAAFRELQRQPETAASVDLAAALREAAPAIREQYPQLSVELLDVLSSYLAEAPIGVKVTPTASGLDAEVTHAGASTRFSLKLAPDGPRIDLVDFFGDGPHPVYTGTNIRGTAPANISVDWYAGSMGAMAFAREWAYRNARNAAELGPPAVRAGGPLVAVIIVVVITFVAGTVITGLCSDHLLHGGVCTLGAVLETIGIIGVVGLVIFGLAVAASPGQPPTVVNGVEVTVGGNPAPSGL